jgi:hypothetical protein
MVVLATLVATAWAAPACADECDATAANVHTQDPTITVSDRTTQDQMVMVTLKNPNVDDLALSCASGDDSQPPALIAKANATWPSTPFYDVLSSAGAVVASSTTAAIRSGAVLCAQRAMTAADNTAVYDANGIRFECTTTSGADGSTRIRLSKLKEATQPQ